MLLRAFLCIAISLQVSPASAGIVGTYKGGFESRRLGISVELRCDGSGLCEDTQIETSDGQSSSSEPRKWELEPLGGCASPPTNEWEECEGRHWEGVRKALDFARKHIEEQEYPDLKTQLRPLLASGTDIRQCYEVPGQAVLCEVQSSPWGKPTVLYMPPMFRACYPPTGFCTYRIIPLFKASDDGTLRSTLGGFLPKPTWPGRLEQEKVAPYIRQLEDVVHSKLVAAPGTPTTARLTVRADFDGDTGRIQNVSVLGASSGTGCSCPGFREAVTRAVTQVAAFPLLPMEERGHVGGGRGRVYLNIVAGNATATAVPAKPVAVGQAYPPFHQDCKAGESVDFGKNKRGDRTVSTLVQCAAEAYLVLGTTSGTQLQPEAQVMVARKVLAIPSFSDSQITRWSRDCKVTSTHFAASSFVVVVSERQHAKSKRTVPMVSFAARPDIDALEFQTIPISFVRCESLENPD